MSIYPVRLNEWYPKGDEYYGNAKTSVTYSKCIVCGKDGKNINYRYAWGHHALPWGYGDVWCTKKCYTSKRKIK